MDSPKLLTAYERCDRLGKWSLDWQRAKIDLNELLYAGISEGLMSSAEDFNLVAGECVVEISSRREIISDHPDIYSQAIHVACLADIVSFALRKRQEAPWQRPQPIQIGEGPMWRSAAFLSPSGTSLRRVVLVTGWNEDRHFSEARSYFSLGEVCVYNLPLQQAVVVLGQNRGGKRHGYWSHGLRHPINGKLRFRKRGGDGFKSTWLECWREDFDQISTSEWLQAMLDDDCLKDVCFPVTIPVPEKEARQKILDIIAKKLDRLEKLTELPDQNLSTCDWPVPCVFRVPCHTGYEPSKKYGFVPVQELA